MIDLDRLPNAHEVVVPDVDAVLARGDALRRRSRVLRFGGTAGALVVVAVAVGLAFPSGTTDGARISLAGAPAGASSFIACNESDMDDYEDPSAIDDLRLLPEEVPAAAGEIVDSNSSIQPFGSDCFVVPVSFSAAEVQGATIRRAVRLHGPSPAPFKRYPGPDFSETTVGGASADLVSFPSVDPGMRQLRWTASDGTSWLLESFGLSGDELLRVAAETDLAAASPSPGWLPDGMRTLYQGSHQAAIPTEQRAWHVQWQDGSSTGNADRLSLSVYEQVPDGPPAAWVQAPSHATTTLSEVRGATAVVVAEGPLLTLSWEERPGITVELAGWRLEYTTLEQIAESLTLVPADDGRLAD